MYCNHCGREIPDGQTCPCQATGTSTQPPVNTMPPVGYPGGPQPVCAVNPVVATVKTIGRSTAFLWGCILYTVYVACSIINSFISLFDSSSYYSGGLLNDYDLDFGLDLSFILPIFVCIGLWMIYNTCKSDRTPMLQSSGLSMIKTIETIELVCTCIFSGIIVLFIIAVLVMGSSPEMSEFWNDLLWELDSYVSLGDLMPIFSGIIVVALLFVLAVFIFMIVFYAKLLKTLKTIGYHFSGMLTPQSVSQFVIVALYLIGAISLFAALGSLIEFGSFFELAAEAVSAAAYFVFASLLQRYKKHMDQLWLMSMTASAAPAAQPFGTPVPAPTAPTAAAPVPAEPPVNSEAPSPEKEVPETAPVQPSVQEEQPTAFCSGCGKPLDANEKYCTQCGQPANR